MLNLIKSHLRRVVALRHRLFEPASSRALRTFEHFCRTLPDVIEDPFFVTVGANDGVSGDPAAEILLGESSWRGLLIEAVPYLCAKLRSNFSDGDRFIIEQAAVGPVATEATFYYVDPRAKAEAGECGQYYDQLGSFRREHILENSNVPGDSILELKLPVRRLSEIIQKHGIRRIDLLNIDTEGYDLQVLQTLNFDEHAPLAIMIEHKHLGSNGRIELMRLLQKRAYQVKDCGVDFFALNESRYRSIIKTNKE